MLDKVGCVLLVVHVWAVWLAVARMFFSNTKLDGIVLKILYGLIALDIVVFIPILVLYKAYLKWFI